MNLQNLLDQFMGSATAGRSLQAHGNALEKLGGQIPGGLATGAAAGGVVALLLGNKSARKFAGKAATYGGAAMLGGLAYKAMQNWQQGNRQLAAQDQGTQPVTVDESTFTGEQTLTGEFQLTLVKAMIAAARADGHIDEVEQQRIFNAVDQMQLSNDMKAMMFDLLRNPVSVEELTQGVHSIEQKSELYLASCMAIDPDHPAELDHLERLARSLQLPQGLASQLQQQVSMAMSAS